MIIRITLSLLLITSLANAQSQQQKDSLINEMCKAILQTKGQPDTTRILTAYEQHLYPFLDQYPEEQRQTIGLGVYYRFQRNCRAFKEILERIDPPQGDWQTVADKPQSNLNKTVCRNFLNHRDFTYLEANGDTVKVSIENGFWTDHFKDGTYSKLKFQWVGDCEFEIEFLASNNLLRKNFSKPGDKYRYQVVDKKQTYYDMSVEIIGGESYQTFRFYY